ncbi:hypothetical protein CDD82_1486 [Ophiocordyceps australis]|uniref:Cwf18 pre-mRNA splicing factor n=1 Tax=Ophiocordyceps australis TaxID=1399860 RepID=A0A2C5YRX0_9HYPO|nr:hypothetical protein CDD82_1486 [Ophiocordyceps australis]
MSSSIDSSPRGTKRKQSSDDAALPDTEQSAPRPAQSVQSDISRQYLSGRNYDFEKKGPKSGFEHPPTLGLKTQTLEQRAAQIEADVQKQAQEQAQGDQAIDLLKLQPKKPNWDLKRKLEPKMAILNVRTDNAIAKIVRERIEAQKSTKEAAQGHDHDTTDGEDQKSAGIDGSALVEGLRVREQEDQEEDKRERQEYEMLQG